MKIDLSNLEEIDGKKFVTVQGKRVPVIKVEAKEITHPDGRKDVVLSMPVIKTRSKNKRLTIIVKYCY